MAVLEVVAVGEACIRDFRRRGRFSIESPNVLGVDCRLRRRLPEHVEVVPGVHVVTLEETTKVS